MNNPRNNPALSITLRFRRSMSKAALATAEGRINRADSHRVSARRWARLMVAERRCASPAPSLSAAEEVARVEDYLKTLEGEARHIGAEALEALATLAREGQLSVLPTAATEADASWLATEYARFAAEARPVTLS